MKVYYREVTSRESTIILQMVICRENEVIAELIRKEDFDKYFKEVINNENTK